MLVVAAAGLGLPGEPRLGRRRARRLWAVALPGSLIGMAGRTPRSDAVAGFTAGAFQALALQHFVDWPWELRRGISQLIAAEGLPARLLPLYNAALLVTAGAATCAVMRARHRRVQVLGHLLGLSTLPLQLASARHHLDWWRGEE